MGAVAGDAFPFSHPMFIDYACSGLRTDFLDVFLGANCTFCISTGTGFDSLPYIFRRDIVFVNHAPMRDLHLSSRRFVNLSQNVLNLSSGEFLSLKQILEIDESEFVLIGRNKHPSLKLIQNTAAQILEAVKEADLRLNGRWIEDEQEHLLQKQFKFIFSRTMQSLGIEIEESRMNYSTHELKNNSRLLADI
jgi:putative glycosyltransferase (TIGR04372 family)